jgi:DMSO/TMAO reductase YedYZ heme-binding membrane subunit
LVVAGAVALVLVGGLVALRPYITPLTWLIRTAALLGYLCIFAAAVSSAYMRELVRFFGRPFVQTHHVLSVTGLVMIVVHPVAAAWSAGSPSVFLPAVDSWISFLRLGGRAAWYLFGIASLAALLRASFKQQWRAIHMLNYLAFFLVTAHAILIGSDFQSPVMKGLAIVMALVLVGVFVQKQLQRRKRRTRSK